MTILHGVDGASVAGIPDCSLLAAEGYAFGFPRMCFGQVRDRAFPEYRQRLLAAGMLERPYAYLRSWEAGASQAEFAIDLAREHSEPFVWLDVEPAKAQRPDGSWPAATDAPHLARPVVLAWVDRALQLGLPFGFYGGPWYLGLLKLPSDFARFPLWLSHYGVAAPRPPAPWTSCAFWQRHPNVRKAGALVDLNETPLTLERLDWLLGGERNAPVSPGGETESRLSVSDEILGGAVAWSDAASGIDRSVERFVDRSEGPEIDPII